MGDHGPWSSVIIHPQVPCICDAFRSPETWPDPGFSHEVPLSIGIVRPATKVWPVPWIKDARLVDCLGCNRTGLQVRTAEAMARYVPGAHLENGRLVFPSTLDPIPYPDGSGRDEETVSDEMVERAARVLAEEWSPAYGPARVADYVSEDSTGMDRVRELAALKAADEEAERKNQDSIRRAIKAALEVLPDAHRNR